MRYSCGCLMLLPWGCRLVHCVVTVDKSGNVPTPTPEPRSESYFWATPVLPTDKFTLAGGCQVHITTSLAQLYRDAGGFQRLSQLLALPLPQRLDTLRALVHLLRLPRNLRHVLTWLVADVLEKGPFLTIPLVASLSWVPHPGTLRRRADSAWCTTSSRKRRRT